MGYSPAVDSTVSIPDLARRPFDFGANHHALDFINTVNGRPSFTRDDLRDSADIIDWANAAGIVKHADQAVSDPPALAHFDAAIALRENLYEVFGPIAGGGVPDPRALAAVTRRAAQALRSAEWVRDGDGYVPHWPIMSVDAISDRLADEAMQLLRSRSVARIGSCAGCGWLFFDVSRAHARRWCSMNACGVRDKMRRYHQRQSETTRSDAVRA
jgi:predicted RNA-binding Zn ribbon-like protein